MSEGHQFLDEWFVAVSRKLPNITPENVQELRKRKAPSLIQGLIGSRLLSERFLEQYMKATYKVDWIQSGQERIDRAALMLVPEKLCRRHRVIPLRFNEHTITVAIQNPLNEEALGDIRAVTGRQVIACMALEDKIQQLIMQAFDTTAVIQNLLEQLPSHSSIEVVLDGTDQSLEERESAQHAPIVRFVNAVIAQALDQHASDIHVEHQERSSVIRYRIDGVLRHAMVLPTLIGAGPLVSRIKVMASLNLAVHFQPQDGRIRLRHEGHEIVLRVSVMPTNLGEKVVMRILDRRVAAVPFEQLGFKSSATTKLERFLRREEGIILVTGPTGAGKTTTLYAMLNRLRTEGSNLVTVEDPIEYKLDGINQIQVNEAQGLHFPDVIRSVLRQDPDIILIGEIRDLETAQASVRAAMTGHLVLSTLHTNDSIGAVARLKDIGLEAFKISGSVTAVTAQRLVRRLCPDCKQPQNPEELSAAIPPNFLTSASKVTIYDAKGCKSCFFSGYKGRFLLLEIFEIDDDIRQGISRGITENELRQMALDHKRLDTLSDDAWSHVLAGDTSLREVLPYIKTPKAPMPAKAHPVVASSESVSAPAPAVNESKKGQDSESIRILIADDDKVTRTILKATLTNEGFTVEEAADGVAALELIAVNPPQLLILDLQMPQANGDDVLRGVRQIIGLQDLLILALTSKTDEKTKQQTLLLGANDYLTKPCEPRLLLERIQALFQRARR